MTHKTCTTSGAALIAALLLLGCGSTESAPAGLPPPPALEPTAKNVGILVFDDLFITEFVAPFDVYKHAGKKLNVFTIAPRSRTVRTHEGVTFHADYTIENAPRIDVLVVPSGNGSLTTDLQDRALVDFVQRTASQAELVTSHCWGAFTLAEAGLLDGREATTFPTSVEELGTRFPTVKTKSDARFVVAGNVVTSGGGLAAYEAALYVVERLLGREEAEKIAAGMVFAPENVASSLSTPP